ncbi:MAG: hypothetical protein ACRDGJ_13000 [Candidatus Limnocylindria bacterium]
MTIAGKPSDDVPLGTYRSILRQAVMVASRIVEVRRRL